MQKFVQPWVAGILAVGTLTVGGLTVAQHSQQSNGKKSTEVCVPNNDHANNCHTKPNPGQGGGNGGGQGETPGAEQALAKLQTAASPLVDSLTKASASVIDAAKKLDPASVTQAKLDSLSKALDGHVATVQGLVKGAADALSPTNVAAVQKKFDADFAKQVDGINSDFETAKSTLTVEFGKVDTIVTATEKAALDTVTTGQTQVIATAGEAQRQADGAFSAYATAYGVAQSAPGTVATKGDAVAGTAGAAGESVTGAAGGTGAAATTGAQAVGAGTTTGVEGVGAAATTGVGQVGSAVTGAVSGTGTAVTDGATAGQTGVNAAVDGTVGAVNGGAGAVTGSATTGVGAVTGGAVTVGTSQNGSGASIGVKLP